MLTLEGRCVAFQVEAVGLERDRRLVELSDDGFEGKGWVRTKGTRVELRPFTRREGFPALLAA
jgi:hypothetical protein